MIVWCNEAFVAALLAQDEAKCLLCLDHNASPYVRTTGGNGSLHLSGLFSPRVTRRLLGMKMDPSEKNDMGHDAVDVARLARRDVEHKILEYARDYPQEFAQLDEKMLLALDRGNERELARLVKLGADLDVVLGVDGSVFQSFDDLNMRFPSLARAFQQAGGEVAPSSIAGEPDTEFVEYLQLLRRLEDFDPPEIGRVRRVLLNRRFREALSSWQLEPALSYLEQGASGRVRMSDGESALSYVLSQKDVYEFEFEILEEALIKAGAVLDKPEKDGTAVIYNGVKDGRSELIAKYGEQIGPELLGAVKRDDRMGMAHHLGQQCDVESLRALDQLGVDLLAQDKLKNSSLHYLFHKGGFLDVDEKQYSLKNKRGRLLLHCAALSGDEGCYLQSREKLDRQNVKDKFGNTPVFYGLQKKFWAVDEQTDLSVVNKKKQGLAYATVIGGDFDLYKKVADAGVDVTRYDEDGEGAMHALAKDGKLYAPKSLGCRDALNKKGQNVAHLGAIHGHEKLYIYAKEIGVDCTLRDRDQRRTADHYASEQGFIYIDGQNVKDEFGNVSGLQKNPLPANERSVLGTVNMKKQGPTYTTIISGGHGLNTKAADAVVDDSQYHEKKAEADFFELDGYERTAIAQIAAQNRNWVALDYALQNGASYSQLDNNGQTPLHCALQGNYVVKSIRYRPNDVVNKVGEDLLMHAASFGNCKAVDYYCRSLGADCNSFNAHGLTPLVAALANNDSRMVTTLKELGANPHMRFEVLDNKSAFEIAYSENFKDLARIMDLVQFETLELAERRAVHDASIGERYEAPSSGYSNDQQNSVRPEYKPIEYRDAWKDLADAKRAAGISEKEWSDTDRFYNNRPR